MPPDVSAALSAAVYAGRVQHHRRFDIEHDFAYRVWMVMAPLGGGELPRGLQPRWRKYMDSMAVQAILGETLRAEDTVWLLTQPSLLGRSFNPVSFYFVLRDQRLYCVVAHITNTPWDESHCYVLRQNAAQCWSFDKTFHVSPFLPMGLRYQWRFRVGYSRIAIDMQVYEGDQRVFRATLKLARQASHVAAGLRWRMAYPLQNLRTLGRIYYQAAVLKFKGARFYPHPEGTHSG